MLNWTRLRLLWPNKRKTRFRNTDLVDPGEYMSCWKKIFDLPTWFCHFQAGQIKASPVPELSGRWRAEGHNVKCKIKKNLSYIKLRNYIYWVITSGLKAGRMTISWSACLATFCPAMSPKDTDAPLQWTQGANLTAEKVFLLTII